ncbi:MAG: 3-oxoacyl-[acyl-carrier protein] reductase [Gammaproteobacteria bacterium]|jgi:3-oxoacyl-[acyl-carrier protein] reductase
MSEFDGKTVLITGAGRGIGRDIARGFGVEGANVCVNYAHSASEAEKVVSEIETSGGKGIACKADISDFEQVKVMVDTAIEAYGFIDILINNAGLSIDGPFLEMKETDWDRVYEVNLKGPFLVSQAIARNMIAGDGGVIVNISATTATSGRPNAANYCSTKAGLNMLTKCMALELGPGIRVNGLGLGFVDSPLVHELYSEDQVAQVIEGTPLKRMTTNQETASFVKLLASKSTSFVTGQTIMFDGGRNMR